MTTHRLCSILVAAASGIALTQPAVTQVPEGTAVIATHRHPLRPGPAGVFLVPLAGGPMTPVTGLPPELTASSGSQLQGAWSVSIRSSDGALVISTISHSGSPWQGALELFILHLNGAAVNPALTQQITLGTAAGLGAAWSTPLPDGRILVFAGSDGAPPNPLASGPMANHFWAIVDTSGSAPAFTLLPNPAPIAGYRYPTIAVDPTGQFAYYTFSSEWHNGGSNAILRQLDLVTGQHCQIADFPGESAFGVQCDDDGTVYVSATELNAVQHHMHTVRPSGCSTPAAVTTVTSTVPVLAWGLDLDRASGRFAVTSGTTRPGFPPALNNLWLIDPITGAVTMVASPPAGGWGDIGVQGVAVHNAIDSYGPRSDGANRYWFDNFPNPGGQPTLGNTGFSLTMRSAPGAATLSALALAFERGSMPVAGIELLVDPATTTLVFMAGSQIQAFPIPMPNVPAFTGIGIRAQSLHFEAGTLSYAASRGLEFHVR